MLFKQTHLREIKAGNVTLAFRKWQNPRVKKGSIIKTSIGQLEILDISKIEEEKLTLSDAIASGHTSLDDLHKQMKDRKGILYKITLRYHSPDPRIALRNDNEMHPKELQLIISKLDKMDRLSQTGPWTHEVLSGIEQNPQLRANDLAIILETTKEWLKPNVRKLKNLGLTISHGVGYSISPRGNVVLNQLRDVS